MPEDKGFEAIVGAGVPGPGSDSDDRPGVITRREGRRGV